MRSDFDHPHPPAPLSLEGEGGYKEGGFAPLPRLGDELTPSPRPHGSEESCLQSPWQVGELFPSPTVRGRVVPKPNGKWESRLQSPWQEGELFPDPTVRGRAVPQTSRFGGELSPIPMASGRAVPKPHGLWESCSSALREKDSMARSRTIAQLPRAKTQGSMQQVS